MQSEMSNNLYCRTVPRTECGEEKPLNGFATDVKDGEEDMCASTLHKIEEVPCYLRYNPYIKNGYRQLLNTHQCCSSLFYVHNETVNIYTHGLAGIFILLWIPLTSPPSISINPVLYMLHYLGCILPFLASAIYHLFMCHNSGSTTYDSLLKFDMCGVWSINAFGTITAIQTTLFCFPHLAHTIVAIYVVVAFFLLYHILIAKSAKERFFPLLPFGIIRYAFLVIRGVLLWQEQPCGDSGAIIYFILMDISALIGGIFNITRIPECFFPDKLDYIFNSHNIMHVIVTLSPILLHHGTMMDFDWMASSRCQ